MARLVDVPPSPSATSVSSDSTGSCIVVAAAPSRRGRSSLATGAALTSNAVIESATTAQRRRSARIVSIHRSPGRTAESSTDLRRRRLARVVELQKEKAASDSNLLDPSHTSFANVVKRHDLSPSPAGCHGQALIDSPQRRLLDAGIKSLDLDWKMNTSPAPPLPRQEQAEPIKRRQSTRLAAATTAATSAVNAVASTVGKRGREVLESGKEKLLGARDNKKHSLRDRSQVKVEAATEAEPERKKPRLSAASAPAQLEDRQSTSSEPARRLTKRWLQCGLYTGQDRDFEPRLSEARNQRKRKSSGASSLRRENRALPLPMFAGEQLLQRGRDFRLPFDVFSPLPPGQPKPEEWKKARSNIFTPDAASEWKRHKTLPPSKCLCTSDTGCDDNCQNRYMFYECDDQNCAVGPEDCGNRSFADLKERYKSGRKYDIGVELVKTVHKGFGVRACRSFEPHQIIVEYAGEVITPEECEKRMLNEYKNNECYYLMMFDQNMIIDATRGSVARFVNHSCEPNCRMIKWTVAGTPRMALFAGDYGVLTGEELTYDYNFDPFSQKNVQTCHCGTATCRGVLGPRQKEKEPPPPAKQKPSTATLQGARRKLQSIFGSVRGRTGTVPKSSPNKLKKHRTQSSSSTTNLLAYKSTPRRVDSTSTDRTLVEKENTPMGLLRCDRRLSRSSSRSSLAPNKEAGVRKASSLKHTDTLGRLTRPRSGLRCDSMLMQTPASARKRAGTANTACSKLLPCNGDVETATDMERQALVDEENAKPIEAKSVIAMTTAKKRVVSVKQNVVRSVRGPRAMLAAERMGIRKSLDDRRGKSLRIISTRSDWN